MDYFAKCDAAVQAWRQRGPQPLNTIPRALDGTPLPAANDDEQPATTEENTADKGSVEEPQAEVPVAEDTASEAGASEEPATAAAVEEAAPEAADATGTAETTAAVGMECPPSTDETTMAVPVKDVGPFPDDGAEEKKEEDGTASLYTETSLPPAAQELPSLDGVVPDTDNGSEADMDLDPDAFEAKAMTNLEVSLDIPGDGPAPEGDMDEQKLGEEEAKEEEEEAEEAEEPTLRPTTMAAATTNLEVQLEEMDDNVEDKGEFPGEGASSVPLDAVDTTAIDAEPTVAEEPHEETPIVPQDVAVPSETATVNTEVPVEPVDEAPAVIAQDETVLPATENPTPGGYHSGIWLFVDRENITHFFAPNFLPPYDTPEKKRIILDVLREEWDEKSLSWKPCGQGSMTRKQATETTPAKSAPLQQLDKFMGGFLSSMDGMCSSPPAAKQSTATK
jgi:hypothetical protein